MNEQHLKRLQETMKLFSIVLEQLEALQWSVHDLIEEIELEINPGAKAVSVPEGSQQP